MTRSRELAGALSITFALVLAPLAAVGADVDGTAQTARHAPRFLYAFKTPTSTPVQSTSVSANRHLLLFLKYTSGPSWLGNQAYVRDLRTKKNMLVSRTSAGARTRGVTHTRFLGNSKVLFTGVGSGIISGVPKYREELYLKDLVTGTVALVSAAADGTPANGQESVPVDAVGDLVLFDSDADNLVPGDTNGESEPFIKNLKTGQITRVGTSAAGVQAHGYCTGSDLSANAQLAVFSCDATNLVPGDTNRVGDVFVKNLATGATTRVSVSAKHHQANEECFSGVLSPTANRVAFTSQANNLAPGHTSKTAYHLYVKNLRTGTVRLVRGAVDGLVSPDWKRILVSAMDRGAVQGLKIMNLDGSGSHWISRDRKGRPSKGTQPEGWADSHGHTAVFLSTSGLGHHHRKGYRDIYLAR